MTKQAEGVLNAVRAAGIDCRKRVRKREREVRNYRSDGFVDGYWKVCVRLHPEWWEFRPLYLKVIAWRSVE